MDTALQRRHVETSFTQGTDLNSKIDELLLRIRGVQKKTKEEENDYALAGPQRPPEGQRMASTPASQDNCRWSDLVTHSKCTPLDEELDQALLRLRRFFPLKAPVKEWSRATAHVWEIITRNLNKIILPSHPATQRSLQTARAHLSEEITKLRTALRELQYQQLRVMKKVMENPKATEQLQHECRVLTHRLETTTHLVSEKDDLLNEAMVFIKEVQDQQHCIHQAILDPEDNFQSLYMNLKDTYDALQEKHLHLETRLQTNEQEKKNLVTQLQLLQNDEAIKSDHAVKWQLECVKKEEVISGLQRLLSKATNTLEQLERCDSENQCQILHLTEQLQHLRKPTTASFSRCTQSNFGTPPAQPILLQREDAMHMNQCGTILRRSSTQSACCVGPKTPYRRRRTPTRMLYTTLHHPNNVVETQCSPPIPYQKSTQTYETEKNTMVLSICCATRLDKPSTVHVTGGTLDRAQILKLFEKRPACAVLWKRQVVPERLVEQFPSTRRLSSVPFQCLFDLLPLSINSVQSTPSSSSHSSGSLKSHAQLSTCASGFEMDPSTTGESGSSHSIHQRNTRGSRCCFKQNSKNHDNPETFDQVFVTTCFPSPMETPSLFRQNASPRSIRVLFSDRSTSKNQRTQVTPLYVRTPVNHPEESAGALSDSFKGGITCHSEGVPQRHSSPPTTFGFQSSVQSEHETRRQRQASFDATQFLFSKTHEDHTSCTKHHSKRIKAPSPLSRCATARPLDKSVVSQRGTSNPQRQSALPLLTTPTERFRRGKLLKPWSRTSPLLLYYKLQCSSQSRAVQAPRCGFAVHRTESKTNLLLYSSPPTLSKSTPHKTLTLESPENTFSTTCSQKKTVHSHYVEEQSNPQKGFKIVRHVCYERCAQQDTAWISPRDTSLNDLKITLEETYNNKLHNLCSLLERAMEHCNTKPERQVGYETSPLRSVRGNKEFTCFGSPLGAKKPLDLVLHKTTKWAANTPSLDTVTSKDIGPSKKTHSYLPSYKVKPDIHTRTTASGQPRTIHNKISTEPPLTLQRDGSLAYSVNQPQFKALHSGAAYELAAKPYTFEPSCMDKTARVTVHSTVSSSRVASHEYPQDISEEELLMNLSLVRQHLLNTFQKSAISSLEKTCKGHKEAFCVSPRPPPLKSTP